RSRRYRVWIERLVRPGVDPRGPNCRRGRVGRAEEYLDRTHGANRKQLTLTANNYDHTVSRNGRRVAWISDRSGSPAIWTMDIDGGNLGMVVKASGESFPQLSPEGKWIAFTAMGSEHWTTLWRVASEGGRA